MTHTILQATDTLFKFGYYLEDGTFIGTNITGKDFTYDAATPMAPVTGKIGLLTETLYDKSSSPEIETISVAKLPTADVLGSVVSDYYDFASLSTQLHTFSDAKLLLSNFDDMYDSSAWNLNGVDLRGRAGNDTIYGGVGEDTIKGGTGDDKLHGGAGDDEIFGQAGQDELYGGNGNDTLAGGGGDDMLFGGADDDYLSGGSGSDTLYGGKGDNRLSGDKGMDTLVGDRGNDWMSGGRGTDELISGGGTDRMAGGNGSDTFVFRDRALDEGEASIVDFDLNHDQLRFEFAADVTAAEAFAAFSATAQMDKGSVLWTSAEHDIAVRILRTDIEDITVDHFQDALAFA